MMNIFYRLLLLAIATASSVVYAKDHEATVDFSPAHELSLPVSGVIKMLNVTTGQRVNKGDEILVLDNIPFKAALTYARSRVTVQQTVLTESQRDLKQQQELYDRTVLAMVELENAESRVKRDKAGLEIAKAQLAEAEYALSYSKLTAPFDAIVLTVHVNQGQAINSALQSKTLITLVQKNYYQATFYVSADEVNDFNIDQAVSVTSAGKQYPGKISSIAYLPSSKDKGKANMFMITAGFTMQDQRPVIGSSARVSLD